MLTVDGYGVIRWRIPPGGVLLPASAAEVLALDAAVRAATSGHVLVVADPDEPARLPVQVLADFVRERLPALGHDIDPADWIPDPVEVAARVDPDCWPLDPPVVNADLTDLVLIAAWCAAGPDARPVRPEVPPERWAGLGGFGEEPPEIDPGPLPEGALLVGAAVHDERVERLEFALLGPDQALLAITLA
ncbi:hypothetical protein [Actinoplanes palleronii]|uniref:Uncharacterized protein n=1 Tax=Actinoplanes palleronii TaxID=113570 RepID=A0ABQ4B0A2_9ACTN|nr:hypothetical protein [Actinoplanes palleronii]GIE64103.1 hypothetical protein Apa02nite_002110 [Actinoplanes palleronii]